jgi:hypothetical protein
MIDGTQKFPDYSTNSRGPTYNFQDGGAIHIADGTLVVHDSAFDTNTAPYVSE